MLHSFLLVGQSNAAGRGRLSEVAPLDNCGGALKIMRNGLWIPMYRPVNPDRAFSGSCLAESFAKAYYLDHADENVQVGIIPCADGGTAVKQWLPGEILFENAVNCAKLAMRTSEIKGIIWHQGEQDCAANALDVYGDRFIEVMNGFRRELSLPELPIIIGGLGDFLANFEADQNLRENFSDFNVLIEKLAAEYPRCAFASAKGLASNSDNLHFSAAALDEFGVRYYNEYKKFDAVGSEIGSADASTERSAMELL